MNGHTTIIIDLDACIKTVSLIFNMLLKPLYYTPHMKILLQSSETDTNFLWTEIQLSKSQLNKKRVANYSENLWKIKM